MADETFFETTIMAGRKRVFVDVKENNVGKYFKIKEQGFNGNAGGVILLPTTALVDLRDALNEAIAALDEAGETVVKTAAAGPAKKRKAAAKKNDPDLQNTVYVGNLSWSTTDQQVADHFAVCGDVENALITTQRSGRSAGWAIVRYTNEADALEAIAKLHGSDLEGRDLVVRTNEPVKPGDEDDDDDAVASGDAPKKPPPAPKEVDPLQIFLGNLSWTTDDAALRAHCESHGTVTEVTILTRGDGKPSGNATVCFAAPEDALAAIEALNGPELDGRPLRVRAAFKR